MKAARPATMVMFWMMGFKILEKVGLLPKDLLGVKASPRSVAA